MSSENGFTPIQTKMMAVLGDGLPHSKDELHECCGPSSIGIVKFHIYGIRKKLQERGEDVVCTYSGGKFRYQYVRLIRIQ